MSHSEGRPLAAFVQKGRVFRMYSYAMRFPRFLATYLYFCALLTWPRPPAWPKSRTSLPRRTFAT